MALVVEKLEGTVSLGRVSWEKHFELSLNPPTMSLQDIGESWYPREI